MYSKHQLDEAHAAWRSIVTGRERDLTAETLRALGWTRQRYVDEWLTSVYGGAI